MRKMPVYGREILETTEGSICPVCGEAFHTLSIMKNHHSQSHHISLEGTMVDCANCGDSFSVNPSRTRRTDNFFCPTKDCRSEYLKEITGEQTNNWNGGKIKTECDNCGQGIERYPAYIEPSENQFCSPDCHNEFRRTGYIGPYGPNWPEQREKSIQQYNSQCDICGVGREEHFETHGKDLNVHHIKPRSEFMKENGELDYEKANRVDNLVPLCLKHHAKVEKDVIRVR